MRLILLVMTMLCWTTAARAEPIKPAEILQAAVVNVIRPEVLRFDATSRGLSSAMKALCASPSPNGKAIADAQFGLVVAAYGQIAYLRLGPMMEDNRADRLLFWPDRRGIGLKQVQAILSNQDNSVTSLAGLRSKSVAVQGLGALDYVLSGTDADTLTRPQGEFRCAYGAAIADNIADIAGALVAGWFAPDGIADHLMMPQPTNVDYRSDTEALEALVGLVSHGLEAMRDQQLNPFLAAADAPAKPKLAPFWRSGQTMTLLSGSIMSMRQLIGESRVATAVAEKDKGLADSIDFEFRNALRALGLVTLPVEQAVADQKQAAALSYLALVTDSLHGMVGEQLSAALGLSVGFSALDGD
ncbi:MAG: peptidase M75, Imelysin [Alphaproteobacteria bacterium]|nr:peptidase M75, Imelysin [Alphaproteobacteria bacterium]